MKLYLKQKYREQIRFHRKLRVFTLVIAAGFAIFALRLAHLQLIAGDKFRLLSDKNRIRLLQLKAPRGLVYDRRGNLLVDNRPSFTVSIIPAEASDPVATLAKLDHFLNFDKAAVLEQVSASRFAPYRQITVARDVSIERAAPIEECSLELPGIIITAEPCRRFPLGRCASHALGYLGEIGSNELERMDEQGYRIGDYVGKAGVELVAEKWLRGEDGGVQVQVYADGRPQIELDSRGNPRVRIDTAGRELLTLVKKSPHPGNIVRLTLDSEYQRIANEEMREHDGAVIVMEATTGAVRALVSKPSFDPNIFVSFGTDEQRLDVLNDPRHPLLNRALQAYAPGSTFKMIMAYAALREGVITPQTRFTCTGSFRLGRRFRCWKDTGHGSLNVVEALAYSCDVFFYNVGIELGIDRIAKYARMFGLGQPTGIDLPGEMRGLVPSPKWKEKAFRAASDKRWYDGETLNASIGQGYTLATPLQMARVIAAIANGGTLVTPYLIQSIETPESAEPLFRQRPAQEHALDDAAALDLVREGLRRAVNSRQPFYGTAWQAKNDIVPLIGKTGTAQVVGFRERADTQEKLEKIPFEQRDHAWFVAATDDPEEPLVIVVFCEHGGHASESAVHVAREVAKRISTLDSPAAKDTSEEGPTT